MPGAYRGRDLRQLGADVVGLADVRRFADVAVDVRAQHAIKQCKRERSLFLQREESRHRCNESGQKLPRLLLAALGVIARFSVVGCLSLAIMTMQYAVCNMQHTTMTLCLFCTSVASLADVVVVVDLCRLW